MALSMGRREKRENQKEWTQSFGLFCTVSFCNDKHLPKLVISDKGKNMPTSESGQMQETVNNNAAGELHYKTAMQEQQ